MNPSSNLFLIGPTGAGKTSIGPELARYYGLSFIDLDQEMEHRCGMPCGQVFTTTGQASFRHRETGLLEEYSCRQNMVMATGAGIVLDAGNRRHLAARGYVIHLQIDLERQWERLRHDTQRPLLAGGDRYARLRTMAGEREPLYREIADLVLPMTCDDIARNVRLGIAMINTHWHRQHAA